MTVGGLCVRMRVVDVKPVDYPARVFDSPAKCAHFSGLMGSCVGGGLPDECLVCPKVLQCDARKKEPDSLWCLGKTVTTLNPQVS